MFACDVTILLGGGDTHSDFQGKSLFPTLGGDKLVPPLVVVPALLRRMALHDRGTVSMFLDMAHRILERSRLPDAVPIGAQLPDLGGPLIALSSVAVGAGTHFQDVVPDSPQHAVLTLRENTAIARSIASAWDQWSSRSEDDPPVDFATFCRSFYDGPALQEQDLFYYDFVPVPCHQRTGAPERQQNADQRDAGPSLLTVETDANSESPWATLPYGFMNMLINFIQVVEANIWFTTAPDSIRHKWSPLRRYHYVHSRLEALMGQSNEAIGQQTERVIRIREHFYAIWRIIRNMDEGTQYNQPEIHGMPQEVVNHISALKQSDPSDPAAQGERFLTNLHKYANKNMDFLPEDGELTSQRAREIHKTLDELLGSGHPDLIKRVHHILQQFDYVADLRGPVPFSVETRRLYGNICRDPDVFKRLGLGTNRKPHMVTVQFHASTYWRACMFFDIFGIKSAAQFNIGATDPGFNTVEKIAQLHPYAMFSAGTGAHKHISRVARRRYMVVFVCVCVCWVVG
jgi:hypothetical protein